MSENKSRLTLILSIIIIVLTVITACGGLFFPAVYQENAVSSGNAFSKAYWFGNDLVTLIVAVPLLTVALILARRGSLRARLVWLGMVYYILYNYSFYLFGAILNRFFLLYVALFTLPVFVLIFELSNVNINDLGRSFRIIKPVMFIGGYMMLLAVLLIVIWSNQWIDLVSAVSPEPVKGDFIRTVGGLDISLIASVMATGAVMIWKKRPWGYITAALLNMGFAVYMLVLTAASFIHVMAGIEGAMAEIPQWIVLCIASLAASLILLKNTRPAKNGYGK